MANGNRATLNRARYAGFDFDTHVDDLRARIQVKFAADYNDFALASMGMMLLDIVSFGLDTLSFYIDRRATETYLSTARTRRGVSRLTRQLGYKMGGAVSSSADLDVQITSTPLAVNVVIPEGFQFDGPNDLTFRATQAVTWTPAEQSAGTIKKVPISEGTRVTETFVSNGTPNQVFELRRVPTGTFPAAGTTTCTVDGVSFEEVDFLDFGATDQFEVAFNDDPATIRFGDGTIGNIPRANASVVVSYVACSGKTGNSQAGSIQGETSPLVVAGETVTLSVNNQAKTSGGDDPETLEHAKAFAGRVFNSRRVAVTRNDYNALAGSFADPVFGRVAVAQAISSRSSESDLFLQTQLGVISGALEAPVQILLGEIETNAADDPHQLELITEAVSTGVESNVVQRANVGTSTTQINAESDSIAAGLRANKGQTFEIDDEVTQAKAVVVSYGPSGTTDLTQPQVDAVTAILDAIASKTSTIRGNIDTQLQRTSAIKDETDKIGLSDLADQVNNDFSYLKQIKTNDDVVLGVVGVDAEDPDDITGLYRSYKVTIQGAADDLDPDVANNAAGDIADALVAIDEHFDLILAADCKANLVTVPILVRDSAGFYTEPSAGLVSSLQDYLTERKEVTQTVRVVSGGNFLVFPVLAVRLGVRQGFSLEQTRTAAETAIDGVLVDRSFGVDLYVSGVGNLSDAITALDGVGFANVTILGYKTLAGGSTVFTDKLDAEGNLIIDDSEVITKLTSDDITVTPESTGQNTLGLTTN